MSALSITKIVTRLIGGAATLTLLTAATCEGSARVFSNVIPSPGECFVLLPSDRPPIFDDDVVQIAAANNINGDFIQCRVRDVSPVFNPGDPMTVIVSEADAQGHPWVATQFAGPINAAVEDLSR